MKKNTFIVALGLVFTLTAMAPAQVPSLIGYQGRVTAGGTNYDGPGYFKFTLVDGGSNLVQVQAATATAVVNSGFITCFNITGGGVGYVVPPAVTISDATGSGAAATAVLTGDRVTGITVNNPGSHYSVAPTVMIDPPSPHVVYQVFWVNDPLSNYGNNGESETSVALPVSQGLFSVLLGDTNHANMGPIPVAVFTNPDVRLRIWFSPAGPWGAFQQLSPDQRVASSGYAMNAANAAFASTSSVCLAVSPDTVVRGQALNIGVSNALIGPRATIAGGQWNSATGLLAVVSGGSGNGALGDASTVAGGQGNVAGIQAGLYQGTYAAVVGGQNNTANGFAAFVGGGAHNQAVADYATVAGGSDNAATNEHATISGGASNAAGYYATVGGGGNDKAGGAYAVVGGGTANMATGVAAVVGGGENNTAAGTGATVSGGLNNLATNRYATVAGGTANAATGIGSVVGGGGDASTGSAANLASGDASTVAGGVGNSATNHAATVSGGEFNRAYGMHSTVVGGYGNQASGAGAFVGGGGTDGSIPHPNAASGTSASILGGVGNVASGFASTAVGGWNTAQGAYSFAAGQGAVAAHDSTFVWYGGQTANAQFSSTASNQFLIYSPGGVGINTPLTPEGGLVVNGKEFIEGYDLFFQPPGSETCGVGWYGLEKPFGRIRQITGESDPFEPDGPVLYGAGGGGLGTTGGLSDSGWTAANLALTWDGYGVYAQAPFFANHPATFELGLTVNGMSIFNNPLILYSNVFLMNQDLYLEGGQWSGLGHYDSSKPFGTNATPDGPVLYGRWGGALGYTGYSTQPAGLGQTVPPSLAMTWDQSQITMVEPLRVSGSLTADNSAILNGLTTVNGVAMVNGTTELNGPTTVDGPARVNSTLSVYGEIDSHDDVYVDGTLHVNGLKLFVVPHPGDINKEIGYVAIEGPEPDTFVRGSTNLVNGEAVITLPENYAMVTADNGLTVQLTPRGDYLQLYVADVSTRKLIVHEAQGKNGRFDYLVQGVRKGYEDYEPIHTRHRVPLAHPVNSGAKPQSP